VEAARDLVRLGIEFSSRVERGQHDFRGGALLGRVHVDWNTSAVIGHRNAVVLVDRDLDSLAKSRHRFIDRIVDDLVNEMV
jgi:hypothetical protein